MKLPDTGHRLSVWMGQTAMLARLSCTARTLRRKVERGEVERRRDGRRNLYRLCVGGPILNRTPLPDTGHGGTPLPDISRVSDLSGEADPYAAIAALLVLVGEVREELREARTERAELRQDLEQLRKKAKESGRKRRLVASATP